MTEEELKILLRREGWTMRRRKDLRKRNPHEYFAAAKEIPGISHKKRHREYYICSVHLLVGMNEEKVLRILRGERTPGERIDRRRMTIVNKLLADNPKIKAGEIKKRVRDELGLEISYTRIKLLRITLLRNVMQKKQGE